MQSGTRASAPISRSVQVAIPARGNTSGKVIVAAEHAAAYGKQAIAQPIPVAVEYYVRTGCDGVKLLRLRAWRIEAAAL